MPSAEIWFWGILFSMGVGNDDIFKIRVVLVWSPAEVLKRYTFQACDFILNWDNYMEELQYANSLFICILNVP